MQEPPFGRFHWVRCGFTRCGEALLGAGSFYSVRGVTRGPHFLGQIKRFGFYSPSHFGQTEPRGEIKPKSFYIGYVRFWASSGAFKVAFFSIKRFWFYLPSRFGQTEPRGQIKPKSFYMAQEVRASHFGPTEMRGPDTKRPRASHLGPTEMRGVDTKRPRASRTCPSAFH